MAASQAGQGSGQRTSLVKRMSRRLSRNGKPKLSEEEIRFISEQTGLQREKLLEKYKRFLRQHPSGKLGFSGLKTMLREAIPEADTSGLVEHVWRIYDTNLDGEIDFREFMLALSVMSKGSAEDNLRQIFRLFDVNSDGRLEREELSRVVGELRKVGDMFSHCSITPSPPPTCICTPAAHMCCFSLEYLHLKQ